MILDHEDGRRSSNIYSSLHHAPKWVHEAQKQIDDIVGTDRLPTFVDRPRLPYIDAIVRGRCIY